MTAFVTRRDKAQSVFEQFRIGKRLSRRQHGFRFEKGLNDQRLVRLRLGEPAHGQRVANMLVGDDGVHAFERANETLARNLMHHHDDELVDGEILQARVGAFEEFERGFAGLRLHLVVHMLEGVGESFEQAKYGDDGLRGVHLKQAFDCLHALHRVRLHGLFDEGVELLFFRRLALAEPTEHGKSPDGKSPGKDVRRRLMQRFQDIALSCGA